MKFLIIQIKTFGYCSPLLYAIWWFCFSLFCKRKLAIVFYFFLNNMLTVKGTKGTVKGTQLHEGR